MATRTAIMLAILAFVVLGGVVAGSLDDDDKKQATSEESDPDKPAAEEPEIVKPILSSVNLGGKRYTTMNIHGWTILTQNLDYQYRTSPYYEDNWWYARHGRLYPFPDAAKACEALGWTLPPKDLINQIALYFAGRNTDPSFSLDFNPWRAYGALIEGGDAGFNATLGGYGYYDYSSSEGISFEGLKIKSGYWTSTLLPDYPDEHIIFHFDNEDGIMNFFREPNSRLHHCRCAKQDAPAGQY